MSAIHLPHNHHPLSHKARKLTAFVIAIVLTTILFNIFAIGHAHAQPMAFGQPLPPQCTSHLEWKTPAVFPVTVFEAPGCAGPWAENLVEFWNWFKAQVPQPKQ